MGVQHPVARVRWLTTGVWWLVVGGKQLMAGADGGRPAIGNERSTSHKQRVGDKQ